MLAADAVLVPVAFVLALALQYSRVQVEAALTYASMIGFLVPVCIALEFALGLHRVRLKDYRGDETLRTIWLAVLLGAVSAALSFWAGSRLPESFHILFAILFGLGYFSMRQAALLVLRKLYRRSKIVRRIAIYGTGSLAMALARELREANDMMVYAFLDDNLHMEGMVLNGVPVYAGVRAGKLLDHFNINTVILALPDASEERRTLIATRLGRLGIEVQNISAFAEFSGGKRLLETMMPTAPTALLAREALHESLKGGHSAYRGRNILISGAGGSIGVELCRQIMQCGPARLVLYEISEIALYHAENEMRVLAEQTGAVIVPVLGSIADETQVRAVLESHQIDVVFHAAAYKHVPIVEANARVGVANNSLGTAVLAKAAARAQVGRFVLVSSDKAVRPGNLMGASKRVAELVVQDLAARFDHTVFSIVRFGNVLGSSGSVIPKFQDQIERGGPVTVTNERVTRYFMTIPEAARLVLEAGAFDESGTLYVLDMGKPVRIADLARKMIEAAGYTVRDAGNPEGDIEIVTTGLRPGEKLHEELFIQSNAERTSHPKIMKIREAHLSELETAAVLRSLRDAIGSGNDEAVIAAVVSAVQEYAPQSLPENAPQMRAVLQRDKRVALPPAE